MTDQPTQKLFAGYLQATKDGARRQYIVLPPVPQEVNGFALATEGGRNAVVLTRKQQNASHRATWNREVAPAIDATYATTLSTWVTQARDAGWDISPLIMVELHPIEYKSIVDKEKEAHHKLLERFARVANRQYGLAI